MNTTILIMALVWAFVYNSHFGWNWTSKSSEEVICDGIFCIIMCLSILKVQMVEL